MEKSIDSYFESVLGAVYSDPKEYSPLSLAYIGDSVYDLLIKTVLVTRNNKQAFKYHKEASSYVKAETQAICIDHLFNELTEEEQDIYKRGRNAKSHSTAKNATVGQYRKATGFEALVGYLYLKKDYDRLFELAKKVMNYKDSLQ